MRCLSFSLLPWSCTSHFVMLTALYYIKGKSFPTETMDYLVYVGSVRQWYACVGELNGCNQVHCGAVRGYSKYILEFSKQSLHFFLHIGVAPVAGFEWSSKVEYFHQGSVSTERWAGTQNFLLPS